MARCNTEIAIVDEVATHVREFLRSSLRAASARMRDGCEGGRVGGE